MEVPASESWHNRFFFNQREFTFYKKITLVKGLILKTKYFFFYVFEINPSFDILFMDSDIFLLNISGQDKPGLTSSLTAVLAEYDAKILDIGQANIHDTLSLGILFQIKSSKKSAVVLKDLLFKSYELDIKASFKPISLEDYENGLNYKVKIVILLLY